MTLKKIILIIGNLQTPSLKETSHKYKFTRKPQPTDTNIDYIIDNKSIKLKNLSILLQKSAHSANLLRLELNNIKLLINAQDENSKLALKASIKIDYFNKRKMDFEPLLEPFTFLIRKVNKAKKEDLWIENYQDENQKTPELIRNHQNALNINFSTAASETINEAVKIYKEQIEDSKPYLVKNNLGYMLEIKEF